MAQTRVKIRNYPFYNCCISTNSFEKEIRKLFYMIFASTSRSDLTRSTKHQFIKAPFSCLIEGDRQIILQPCRLGVPHESVFGPQKSHNSPKSTLVRIPRLHPLYTCTHASVMDYHGDTMCLILEAIFHRLALSPIIPFLFIRSVCVCARWCIFLCMRWVNVDIINIKTNMHSSEASTSGQALC